MDAQRGLGLRQEDLARAVGISRPQLANALRGRFGLGEEPAARLLELVGVRRAMMDDTKAKAVQAANEKARQAREQLQVCGALDPAVLENGELADAVVMTQWCIAYTRTMREGGGPESPGRFDA